MIQRFNSHLESSSSFGEFVRFYNGDYKYTCISSINFSNICNIVNEINEKYIFLDSIGLTGT